MKQPPGSDLIIDSPLHEFSTREQINAWLTELKRLASEFDGSPLALEKIDRAKQDAERLWGAAAR